MTAKTQQREILVFSHWKGLPEPVLIGVLKATPSKSKEIFSFEYSREWLSSEYSQLLDPDLELFSGSQYLKNEKSNFGIFLDSSPDRWGRLLMRRREAISARTEKRKEKTLMESDYLLGVFDNHRMGAIRFKENGSGPFLDDNMKMASPPWTLLRELENASLQLEKEDATNDPEYLKWLNMLIVPGSSLGGSRPKAGVIDPDNNLWIAKFPSRYDDKDMGAWEMIVNELAVKSGLNISVGMAQKFSGRHHTYLTKRFDRGDTGERIHFASAMTLLGYTDGKDSDDGISYLELAEFLIQNGANVSRDLEELWRRIVFSICVTNTDDHLRNHGFILTEQGWELSPAYDINAVETGTGLKLNISDNDNSLDLALAREVSMFFRVNKKRAEEIIKTVIDSVKGWKEVSRKYGITKDEQDLISPAFLISE